MAYRRTTWRRSIVSYETKGEKNNKLEQTGIPNRQQTIVFTQIDQPPQTHSSELNGKKFEVRDENGIDNVFLKPL